MATNFLDNSKAIGALIAHGICHRYPRLNWVSVESAAGWVPSFLEAMDWQWKGTGVALDHPEFDLLPSEYFRRQIYAAFWFEQASARFAMEQIRDNLLYETNFPHPTSMSPGPASPAVRDCSIITIAIHPESGTRWLWEDGRPPHRNGRVGPPPPFVLLRVQVQRPLPMPCHEAIEAANRRRWRLSCPSLFDRKRMAISRDA